ncbi:putative sodium-coupled neutral amino acid transporter 7 isoform X3 [Corvus cornix cornix]|uniref:putative sodium-coupled neutral amino acid transporter 7 isoform X2 n=1 Tax=Corvus brachyrhynchos TaxID=85066 RepID=UPI0008166677|nr:PREDICTED: putative sodium-coupled neutral amino acid transporter 7 isoform X2 [Corvus brachyrhynchos]XP_039414237.1 putative sodium-coupled neutral amino acid transporter 7 isoform X3 [Corvus cornix cornix]
MAQGTGSINSDYKDWEWSDDAGERARLLQSPSVETVPKNSESQGNGLGTTSALGAVFIVVNAALGAGLLNFPAAFSMAGGVAAGIALQMCMLIFIIGGLVILAYCSQASNERTYQEVVWAVCGKVPGVLCEVAIAVYTFGTCIAFLIIIGDQEDKIIAALVKEPEEAGSSCWYTDRKFTISITAFLLILPLSIPKEIGFQKYASSLSVIGTWYVTAVIIIKYIWPDKELVPVEIPTSPSTWTAVFNAMPTICFGFQCHVSSVPVFNSMKQPEVKTWGAVVTAAMVIALFVYTGTGACGFLTFGAGVEQDVLMSYPSNDIPVALARAFIILCVLTSYPILHFCGRALPDSSQALRDPRNQGNQLVGPGQLWGLHGHPWSLHLWTDHCQCHLCGSYSLTPPGWTALMLLKGWRFPLGPKGSGKKTCWCVGKIQENCCDLGLS